MLGEKSSDIALVVFTVDDLGMVTDLLFKADDIATAVSFVKTSEEVIKRNKK